MAIKNQDHYAPWHGTDLREVQTGTVTAVVVVAVHVKDFLALDGQETRKDTFGQTGTENDDLTLRCELRNPVFVYSKTHIILFIHDCSLTEDVSKR